MTAYYRYDADLQAFFDDLARQHGGGHANVKLVRDVADPFLSANSKVLGSDPEVWLVVSGDEVYIEARGGEVLTSRIGTADELLMRV